LSAATEHIEEVTGQANGREKDASPHSSGIQKQQWPAMSQWKCVCFKPQDYSLDDMEVNPLWKSVASLLTEFVYADFCVLVGL
jgi:hypothetical protein